MSNVCACGLPYDVHFTIHPGGTEEGFIVWPCWFPEEEIPAWVAVIAALAVVVTYAWWTAWTQRHQIGA